jgi:FlaG/FlaF family flagellin (archaellin)
MSRQNTRNCAGVSGVIGEMLMIGIVLILVAVFTTSLADYLPRERTPSATILMSNDTEGNLTLWHKGGDWVNADRLQVVVWNATGKHVYTREGDPRFVLVPDAGSFDLGSNITVTGSLPFIGNESVSLATDRAVIFSGSIGRIRP